MPRHSGRALAFLRELYSIVRNDPSYLSQLANADSHERAAVLFARPPSQYITGQARTVTPRVAEHQLQLDIPINSSLKMARESDSEVLHRV